MNERSSKEEDSGRRSVVRSAVVICAWWTHTDPGSDVKKKFALQV